MVVQCFCPRLVDQLHAAFGQAFAVYKGIVGVGDDIYNRIADGEHVEADVGHLYSCKSFARPSGGSPIEQVN